MSRLVVIEYLSLDGVIQAPGHSGEDREGDFALGGWTGPFMDDHARYNAAFFQAAGGFLLGRKTYEIWAAYWPTVPDTTNEIARALNTASKYVASMTLQRADWSGTTVMTDVPREVAELRRKQGKPIFVLGSADLVQTLIEHDLVDEYQLWLHPVVLGGGKRLFRDSNPAGALKLIDSTTTAGGLVILNYARES